MHRRTPLRILAPLAPLVALVLLAAGCGDSSGAETVRERPPIGPSNPPCIPGEIGQCYGGPEPLDEVGDCHLGTRECRNDRTWDTCRGWRRVDSVQCENDSPSLSRNPSGPATTTPTPSEPAPNTTAPPSLPHPVPSSSAPVDPPPSTAEPTDVPPSGPASSTEPAPTAPPTSAATEPQDPGPASPGTYRYTAVPVASFGESVTVDWHPDGSVAVVGRRSGAVHLVDGDTLEVTRLPLPETGATLIDRVRFDPFGRAWVMGTRDPGGTPSGFIHILEEDPDDGGWSWSTPPGVPAEQAFRNIRWDTHDGDGLLLSATRSSPWIFRLWSVDPETLTFTLRVASASGAGCQDVAPAPNEFGEPGYLVVCGINGGAAHHWTRVAGEFEVRSGLALGTTNLGNISSTDSHPDHDRTLVIGWSGRTVHRFIAGSFVTNPPAPSFSTRGISSVRFAPDGRRGLIVGRRTVSPPGGLVMEVLPCDGAGQNCPITEVLVPGFDAPPYNAGSNAHLHESAWRPGCDGGLIVGGESGLSLDRGFLIRFDLEGGRPCWPE
ncbi:MAG: hypothetical protein EA398_02645 [Deltaproteobacteria bacterium]|nr:MAG: hypothetical protein EA398_02645 [Deltaproteobacteria bacterium]